ncbi:hypothetical protein VIGAN_06067700, partial [Vigna angularis var. angularis]
MMTSLLYMNDVYNWDVTMMDPEKIKTVKEWPEPHNIKALRGFLGLSGYYRRFIKDYGKIVKPLTNLLRKG